MSLAVPILPLKRFARRSRDLSLSALATAGAPIELMIRSGRCGFFGDVAMALNGIRFAELNGLKCSIDWGADSLYHDPEAEPNSWSYAFKQATFDFRSNKATDTIRVPFRPGSQVFHPYPGMSRRESLAQAIEKFCTLHTTLASTVEVFRKKHFSDDVMLGVHYRGTDVLTGVEGRAVLPAEYYLQEVRTWLKRNPAGKVFLATDDQAFVEALESEIRERVVYRNALRSVDGVSIHGHYDHGIAGSGQQKVHEVVLDAYLLSECNFLIRGDSRVTWFSLCRKPNLEYTDIGSKYFHHDAGTSLVDG